MTPVGPLSACGAQAVALSFVPSGALYTADFEGAFCRIELGERLKVTRVGTLGSGLALTGDIVAVGDGTVSAGATGFPKLFGAAFALGEVFAFSHDGSGAVIAINPRTGKGTLFGTFQDPQTGRSIRFAGAGVNAMVPLG